jgi:hypothetical protein
MKLSLAAAVTTLLLFPFSLAQNDDYGDYGDYQDYAGDYGQQDSLYHDYAQRQETKT